MSIKSVNVIQQMNRKFRLSTGNSNSIEFQRTQILSFALDLRVILLKQLLVIWKR